MPLPFEVEFAEVRGNLDAYVDEVFASLESEFMTTPKGPGFVEYPVFEKGYEALKRGTRGFDDLSAAAVEEIAFRLPISLIVLRCMLGFTSSEWAYLASQHSGLEISQGAARAIDRKIRLAPEAPLSRNGAVTEQRVRALVAVACNLLTSGAPAVPKGMLHRLDKADTAGGTASLRSVASIGVPYPMLLYERFLGRPFAGHRDSVSELVGDVLEIAIEKTLAGAGVSFRKTKRAERLPNLEQTPDFIIPDEFAPRVVIEAKVAEDDGTARDKVTRVANLRTLSLRDQPPGQPRFDVVACISGRGFGIRREDMKRLLIATEGNVFTLRHIGRLVECTRLRDFVTRR